MKKDSNKRVKWILIQAAHSASKADPGVKELHDRIASKKGENEAVIRVTNEMAIIIWHMLKIRQEYHQMKKQLYRSKLRKTERIAS